MKRNSRRVATEIIARWMEKGSFPDREMASVRDDRAFVTEMVYGVVRRKLTLEYIAQKFVNRKPEDFVLAALYVGIYQLCFMDNVEEFAAINETVNVLSQSRHRDAKRVGGMINAVLRNVQEEREEILKNLERQPDEIRLSHPEQLVHRWRKQYGERDTRRLCEWNNLPAETIIRVETERVTVANFMKELEVAGIHAERHPFESMQTFVTLPRGVPVPKVPGFEQGWFTVQDPATSVSVELLDPMPGESILDSCAAPGGKTVMMAGLMEGEGELVAMDVHDDRIETLKDTVRRTGWDFIEVIKGDASKAFPQEGRLFDAVMVDAPCLNTGVLRRRVDARWRVTRDRIEMLKKTQRQILNAMSKVVKPGGRLVYSTCSLEQEENEELVRQWVRDHDDFRLVKAKRLFPPKSGTDGAYAALLRKAK
jgi:16S rRNA (cytosine967-C5)-methyltransferase